MNCKRLFWRICCIACILSVLGCSKKETIIINSGSNIQQAKQEIVNEPINSPARLYVTAMMDDKVMAIDIDSGEIISEQNVGSKPYGIAIDYKNRQLVVVCALANEVWFLDADTLAVLGKTEVGKIPALVTIDDLERKAYVSNTVGDAISVIDLDLRTELKQIVTGKSPYNIAVLPNRQLAVLNHEDGNLVRVDLTDGHIIETYEAVQKASGMAVDLKREVIFSGGHGAEDDGREIFVHNLREQNLSSKIDTGGMPSAMMIFGDRLYVLLHESEQLVVLDIKEGIHEINRFSTEKYPFTVESLDNGKKIAVTNMDSDSIQIFDSTDGYAVSRLDVPGGPVGIAYYQNERREEQK